MDNTVASAYFTCESVLYAAVERERRRAYASPATLQLGEMREYRVEYPEYSSDIARLQKLTLRQNVLAKLLSHTCKASHDCTPACRCRRFAIVFTRMKAHDSRKWQSDPPSSESSTFLLLSENLCPEYKNPILKQ